MLDQILKKSLKRQKEKVNEEDRKDSKKKMEPPIDVDVIADSEEDTDSKELLVANYSPTNSSMVEHQHNHFAIAAKLLSMPLRYAESILRMK